MWSLTRWLLEVLGSAAMLRLPDAVRGCSSWLALVRSMHILTFGGGTNEMQRDLIAIFGLNMPGSPRVEGLPTMDFSSMRPSRS